MHYTQPQLPYAPDALAPAISEDTVNYHYGKHEKAYIDNLNSLIKGTEFEDEPLEDIIRSAEGPLFNNASQAWNHIFYFFSFFTGRWRRARRRAGRSHKARFRFVRQIQGCVCRWPRKIVRLWLGRLSKDEDGKLFITQDPMPAIP